jgi:DNA-binding beta-propeller fold protein YncE
LSRDGLERFQPGDRVPLDAGGPATLVFKSRGMRLGFSLGLAGVLTACGGTTTSPPTTPVEAPRVPTASPETSAGATGANGPARPVAQMAPAPTTPAPRQIPLTGASGPVTLDYIAYDRARARVWVPVGDTGSVDVFDVASAAFTRVDGFRTEERESRGKKRMMGPSAASVGDGFVYVGDRASSEVCPVDASTLKLGHCLELPAPTDGVAYVASVKEVWVTTPRNQALTVLDASKPDALKAKLVIPTPGAPEGFAVDEARGLFYTNLEDRNRTLAIELRTHKIKATWTTGCGADGPRGVAVDGARNFVFVACTDSVQILDGGHDGAPLGKLDTGAGVDNIDYVDSTKLLYAAAGNAARLTVARVDDKGRPSIVATMDTAEGARNAVGDDSGNVYVADPLRARLLIMAVPSSP